MTESTDTTDLSRRRVVLGELVATEGEAGVVVGAGAVGLPEVDERPGHRLAVGGDHRAGEYELGAAGAGADVGPLR
jgi:hypothetical protein